MDYVIFISCLNQWLFFPPLNLQLYELLFIGKLNLEKKAGQGSNMPKNKEQITRSFFTKATLLEDQGSN